MADKTTIIKIEYDTEEAIKNLQELTSVVEGEKVAQAKLKAELEKGTISQKEYSNEVEKSKQKSSEANSERKTTLQLIASEKGSVNELKANIKLLTQQRDKLNQSTAEGRKAASEYTAKINEMKGSLKDMTDESKKTGGAFFTLGQNLKSIPGPIGGVINGFLGMTKAAVAFIATPVGAVIGALALAFKALMSYLKGSEEGQNRLNTAMNYAKAIWEALENIVERIGKIIMDAITKPKEAIIKLGELIKTNLINRFEALGIMGQAVNKIFKGEFKEGFKDLANGALQAVTGIENVIGKVQELGQTIKKEVEANVKKATELSKIQAAIDKEERRMIVDREKTRVAVDELLLKSKQDDIYTEQQRLEQLKEASGLIDELATREENLAAMRLKESRLRLEIEGDSKENLLAVAQAEADLISKKAEGLEARRKIEGQISNLNSKALAEKEKAANKEVEIDKKAQEDILKRRGEAIFKLAELRAKELEDAAKTYAEQRDAQIANAEEERERKLAQEGLLAEEIELIQAEHKARLAEIETAYQENIAQQRAEALQQAYDDLNGIIQATQGMADERVSIMSDAFARISTINWQEVDSASDAFLAIGTAAQGLTSLITAGHEAELASMQSAKERELQAAGDNQERRAEIEARYARQIDQIKRKQFEEDKKKALIDASIATALAIIKGLSSGLPMPGILMAALAGVVGGIQIAAIARQKYTPTATYADGGVIGGKPHSQGGTKFYGTDGSMFEAEKGEAMYVLNKDATSEIAALSIINESHGGRSLTGSGRGYLAEGGEVQPVSVERMVDEAIQRTPIFVEVGSIETGLTNHRNAKKAGLL